MKILLLLYVFLSFLAIAQAQQNQGEFPIGDIKFRYGATHPELHSLAELDEFRGDRNRKHSLILGFYDDGPALLAKAGGRPLQ